MGILDKPSMRAFIQYTECGYFGDSDLITQRIGICQNKGRDSMAVGECDSTIFMMPLKEINKIQDSFEDIYQELIDIASKRHTNHRILMSNEIRDYIQQVKLDTDQSSSSISDSEDIFSQNGSQNAEDSQFIDPLNDKLKHHAVA